MNILLTGASGFVGANVLKVLAEDSDWTFFCPYTERHGGNLKRIESLINHSDMQQIKLFEFDLASDSLIDNLHLPKIDFIINFASESHVDRSIISSSTFIKNNLDLMINILEFAKVQDSVPSLIHFSTDEVYGSTPLGKQNVEWESIHLPTNPYSGSKSAQEVLAISYSKTFAFPVCIVNSTNIIGKSQNVEKFLPKIIEALFTGQRIFVDSDGLRNLGSRKYLDVADVAEAIRLLITLGFEGKLPTRVHIAGEEEISNLELVEIISKFLNLEPIVEIKCSDRPCYDLRYDLDSTYMKSLGWNPSRNIRATIEEIVRWTRDNPGWIHK